MKRVAYCTFGCRLNQYDTEAVRTLLERDGGYRTVALREEADVYVVNTCSVTARADATARKAIRRLHAEHPGACIVVTGCYAQRAPEEITALPGVAVVVGAADRARIVEEVERAVPGAQRSAVSPIAEAATFLEVPITEMMERSRAFVKVQEGCDKACAFCIVPQTRGRSRSRRPENVLAQVRELVAAGYGEVVITGVDVGDYGLDLAAGRRSLPALLEQILAVPGLARLRLSSIEPSSVTDELIALMAHEERFARHFHIPLQSASNAVLARMQRNYSAERFAELVWRIADAIPECGIGTDVICGFPGESEEDFAQTFERLVELPITYLHPFTYSVRPGSRAQAWGDDVAGEVKKRRTRSLKRLSQDKRRAFGERHLGRVMAVLVEVERRAGAIRAGGWTDNYLRVDVGPESGAQTPAARNAAAADARAEWCTVRITGIADGGLVGERAAADPAWRTSSPSPPLPK